MNFRVSRLFLQNNGSLSSERKQVGELKPHIHKFKTKTHFGGSKLTEARLVA